MVIRSLPQLLLMVLDVRGRKIRVMALCLAVSAGGVFGGANKVAIRY
jgi:hypothetical protein